MARVAVRVVSVYDVDVPSSDHAAMLAAAAQLSSQEVQSHGVQRSSVVHPLWIRSARRRYSAWSCFRHHFVRAAGLATGTPYGPHFILTHL